MKIFKYMCFGLLVAFMSCKTTKETSKVTVNETKEKKHFQLIIKEGFNPEEIQNDYADGFIKFNAMMRNENIWGFLYEITDSEYNALNKKFIEDERILHTKMTNNTEKYSVEGNKMYRPGSAKKSTAPVK